MENQDCATTLRICHYQKLSTLTKLSKWTFAMPYADITKPPAPLPSAKLQFLKPGFSLQPPLTRLGSGPGLILLTTPDIYDEQLKQRDDAPTAVLKWAEEGYTVAQISASAINTSNIKSVLSEAITAFDKCEACQPKDKIGLIGKVAWLALGYDHD